MMRHVAMRRCVVLFVLLLLVGISAATVCLDQAAMAVARTLDAYLEGADASGEVERVLIDGKPPEILAQALEDPSPNIQAGINVIGDVPAYDWSYGCSATSAAMLFGFYDRNGYTNMYAGGTNYGIAPLTNAVWGHTAYPGVTCGECPLSATHQGVDGRSVKGHVDDYWVDYGDSGPDPFVGNWTEHVEGDCTGDYMGTNQSNRQCTDGATYFFWYTNGDPLYDYTGQEPTYRDGCHGMKLFAESRGYTVVANFTQLIQGQGTDPAKGFTFAQYCAEIDAGRPVLVHVTGHTMLGYGYNTTGNVIHLRDTWDYSSHTMTWGSTYSGMQHKSVSVIRLESSVAVTVETLGLVSSYPATVYYTQGGVSKTAATYGTWSDNVDRNTIVAIDNAVTVSTTERYGTSAAVSWTAIEAATYSVPYHHQWRPLISADAAGPGHADMDSANHATLTYYRYGSAGVYSVFDGHAFSDWVDAGTTASLSNPSSGSTSTHRWYCPGVTSWTVNDAGSLSATYWDQFKPAISTVTAGDGHADLDAANSVALTYYQCGSAGTHSLFDAQSFNDWVDRGSAATLSESSSGSTSTHRWYCPGATSWTINDAGSLSATYWDQIRPTVSVFTAGTGHTDLSAANHVALAYSAFGTAGTANVFDAQGFSDWLDTGSAVSVSGTSSASTATHRWCVAGAASWVVNDASSITATCWEQFKPTISVVTTGSGHTDLNASNYVTLSYSAFGTAGTASVFDARRFNDWVDMGETASLSNSSSASTSTHRWYSPETTSWVIGDTGSHSAAYYDQYLLAITDITGLDSSHPTTVTFTGEGVTISLTAFDSWTEWADAGSTVVVAKSVEGGWIGDWSTGDVTEWAVVSPISDPIRYQRSYGGLYALIGGLLAAVAIIGLAVFLLLRLRGRGYGLRDLPDYFSDRLGQ